MKTVWKYQIPFYDYTAASFDIPRGADIVNVAYEATGSVEQFVSIWAEVDPAESKEKRSFEVYGTGHSIPDAALYHGTVLAPPLVLHVYERFGGEAAA